MSWAILVGGVVGLCWLRWHHPRSLCTSKRVACRCMQRGRHSQHRCAECAGSWRDGEVGIKFGGNDA